MYDRREQVQAHSFLSGRLNSALLRTDPDAAEQPLRRTSTGLLGGIAIGGLVVAGVLVAGLLSPGGGDKWRAPGTLVVDEDTGNRYLLVAGELRPVLNHASARLALGADMQVVAVSSADLDGTPRGAAVGILGAPDEVPSRTAAQPWTVCAGDDAEVSLTIGETPGTASTDRAALVRVGEELHVAWRDRRFRVTAPWAPRALGLDPADALQVHPAWLNALPAGPDLGAPDVRRGGAGRPIGGRATTTGQPVRVPGAVGGDDFVVTPTGLAPVTATVSTLLAADPAGAGLPVLEITPAQLAEQTVLPAPEWQADLPPEPPAPLERDGRTACVRWAGDTAHLVTAPAAGPAHARG
ncbi:type VII secretion protein EccB, partial [Saccharothrix longispora]|uniref:type VII secretion protein EccB n=1 Tax=Saccharothrix longispora TaxID=33920 RepID=UPI0028FDB77D